MAAQDNSYVVGLDIGTTKICAIIGRKNNRGRIEVLGLGETESLGVSRGVVINIELAAKAIHTALTTASTNAGNLPIHEVFVGIAGQHIRSMYNTNMLTRANFESVITEQEIQKMTDDMYNTALPNGEQVIHVFPQEYRIDLEGGVTTPAGMFGTNVTAQFHIITGQTGAIKNIYRCVEKAGFKIASIVLEPVASSAAVLLAEEIEAGIALIDIGGGTTDVAIFHNNIIRKAAVVPFGGNVITQDIMDGCKILHKLAEEVKLKYGIAIANTVKDNKVIIIPALRGREDRRISQLNLAHIIQARLEEIIAQVMYTIEASGYQDKLIGGIVLTGGGSQVKYLCELTAFISGMECRIGIPEIVETNSIKGLDSPKYATGIGLIMEGYRWLENNANRNSLNKQSETQVEPNSEEDKTQQANTKKNGFFTNLLEKFLPAEEGDTPL